MRKTTNTNNSRSKYLAGCVRTSTNFFLMENECYVAYDSRLVPKRDLHQAGLFHSARPCPHGIRLLRRS